MLLEAMIPVITGITEASLLYDLSEKQKKKKIKKEKGEREKKRPNMLTAMLWKLHSGVSREMLSSPNDEPVRLTSGGSTSRYEILHRI